MVLAIQMERSNIRTMYCFRMAEPRKFLFHENWLDRAYNYDPKLWLSLACSDSSPSGGTSQYSEMLTYPTGSMVYLAHATIAISASLWQLKRASVIYAWATVPDYTMLGPWGPSLAMVYPNTCACVTGTESLQGLVKVVERNYRLAHCLQPQ